MLVATSVAGAATGGVAVVPGAAEALTSGSGFLARLSGQRRSDAHRIIRETTTTVRTQWTDWIATSSRTDERDLANAVASFEEVAPRIAPRPADVVAKRLHASAIADLILERAEVARPEVYADKSPHNATAKLAREFLHELVRRSYALLTANPDYLDQIAPDLWRGVLEQLGDIKADTGAIRFVTEQIRDDYKREIDFLKDTLHARETDLISLLRIILVRHVPKEDILPALEQSYERLSQLRENWSSLASLANEEPEIAPLLTAADEAMAAGEHFSLERASQALAEADARFLQINREREEQFKRGEENRARILGKRAELAGVTFDYGGAADLYRQQAECFVKAFGEAHPSTATSYNNVASNLDAQGRFSDAEPLYRKGLEIRERVLGEAHPATATSYNNVASNLEAQGHSSDAEPLYRKALEISERVLGEAHPTTEVIRGNLHGFLEHRE